MLHSHDNVMQRLQARNGLVVFLITDGNQLSPAVLKNFFRANPAGIPLFTTDCMTAAGAPPGRYRLTNTVVEAGLDRIVRKPGETCYVGSSLSHR